MDTKKIVKLVAALAVLAAVIGAVVLAVRLVTGLISGAFNLVLGALVVLALIALVAWMFCYAGKNK